MPLFSNEQVAEVNFAIGWFNLLPLEERDLLTVEDKYIIELSLSDGSHYFYMQECLSVIRCVWVPDLVSYNNCRWVIDENKVDMLIDCQECFLPTVIMVIFMKLLFFWLFFFVLLF